MHFNLFNNVCFLVCFFELTMIVRSRLINGQCEQSPLIFIIQSKIRFNIIKENQKILKISISLQLSDAMLLSYPLNEWYMTDNFFSLSPHPFQRSWKEKIRKLKKLGIEEKRTRPLNSLSLQKTKRKKN